jgi:mRNA interferase ChpB
VARRAGGGQGSPLVDRGDIYLVSLDPASGHEQRGMRPVLVVTSADFNRVARVPIIVPITTGGDFARKRGLTVALDGAGTKTKGVALCHQPRALDLASRNARKVERLPEALVDEVMAKLVAFFD